MSPLEAENILTNPQINDLACVPTAAGDVYCFPEEVVKVQQTVAVAVRGLRYLAYGSFICPQCLVPLTNTPPVCGTCDLPGVSSESVLPKAGEFDGVVVDHGSKVRTINIPPVLLKLGAFALVLATLGWFGHNAQIWLDGAVTHAAAGVDLFSGTQVSDTPTVLKEAQAFYGKVYPQVYNKSWVAVTSDHILIDAYPSSATVACGSKQAVVPNENAYAGNCPGSNAAILVADKNLLDSLGEEYGTAAVGMVFSHELGHVVQFYQNIKMPAEVYYEQQADCFSGAWLKDYASAHQLSPEDVNRAATALLLLRDPPGMSSAYAAGSHGSAFDRIRVLGEGYDQGAAYCATYTSKQLPLTEEAFTAQNSPSNGTITLDDALKGGERDLETYYTKLAQQGVSKGTKGPDKIVNIGQESDINGQTCEGVTLTWDNLNSSGALMCDKESGMYVSTEYAKTLYEKLGDFAPVALIALEWAKHSAPGASPDQIGCLVGSWDRWLFNQGKELGVGPTMALSPGDLDEQVAVLLLKNPSKATNGFEQVRSVDKGFTEGIQACS